MLHLQNIPPVLISISTTLAYGFINAPANTTTFARDKALRIEVCKNQHYSYQKTFVLVYDSTRKESSYYRNGKVKFNRWTVYDHQGQIEKKMITEGFRKNGKRKYIRQYTVNPDYGPLIAYEVRYDTEGVLVFERSYAYDRYGILIQYEPEACDSGSGNAGYDYQNVD